MKKAVFDISGDTFTVSVVVDRGDTPCFVDLDQEEARAIARAVEEASCKLTAMRYTAERARLREQYEAHQRHHVIAGVDFVVQDNLPENGGEAQAAWLSGWTRDTSPFVVQRDQLGATARPWIVEGRPIQRVGYGGDAAASPIRHAITGGRRSPRRFATYVAAARFALNHGLHHVLHKA